MKKLTSLVFTLLLAMVIAKAQDRPPTKVLLVPTADSARLVSYDMSMIGIINGKCLGCHSPTGRNDDAKEALQWEQLQNAGKADAYAILDEILEVLDEGSMPPEKMIERFPHLKLTEEETATLKTWAENTLARLEE